MKFNEVKYQDSATKSYLGSPSIIRTDKGDLLVTHDYFGTGCPKNHENEEHLTSVYRSSDEGMTWFNVTHIANAFWSNLFKHKGAIYLLGTSQQNGSIVIRRSEDNGNTWTGSLTVMILSMLSVSLITERTTSMMPTESLSTRLRIFVEFYKSEPSSRLN